MGKDILVDKHEHIARVVLNRPSDRNAISYSMWLELAEVFTELDRDHSVRVVIITGEGEKAFSAGADIKDFQAHRSDPTAAGEYTRALEGTLEALEKLSKPSVARVAGYCVGGGCELALSADLRIASENSKFGIPVARLGITTGYRESQRLVQVVGAANALYMLLTANLIDEHEALRIGLVHEVVPLRLLDDRISILSRQLRDLAPASHRIHKRIFKTLAEGRTLDDLAQSEKDVPLSVFSTWDFHEGVRAFQEKRSPRFHGE